MVSKKKYVRAIIISALISALVFTLGTAFIMIRADFPGIISMMVGKNSDSTAKLEAILNDISKSHLYEIDKTKLIDNAIKGMLDSIDDPYTYYLSADEYDDSFSSKNPTFTGIGITVDTASVDDAVVIKQIYKGSNVSEVGILEGDEIIAVEDIRCTPDNKEEMLEKAKGEEGTSVNITIRRDGKELTFSVERRSIRVELAVSEIFEDSVGYIRLRSFQAAAKDDFENCLSNLRSQNITSLIIDLRGNGGGYKHIALDLVDYFVPKGTVCSTVNNKGVVSTDSSTGKMLDIPFVLLVDKNSASASELFAGAVQDYGTGLLIGQTTFGKGIVQYTRQLEDKSYYQFTAEQWLTPKGRTIHGVGLTPDIEVKIDDNLAYYIDTHPTEILSLDVDLQLKTAIETLLANEK